MFRRILVPLNGTPQAEKILPHAVELARCHGATLVIFRVLSERGEVLQQGFESGSIGGATAVQVADNVVAAEAGKADAYLFLVESDLQKAGIRYEVIVQEGDARAVLATLVQEKQIDLVAMTTSGRSALSRLIFGSTAEDLLRELSIPVLLLRAEK